MGRGRTRERAQLLAKIRSLVVDAGPCIALASIGQLGLLEELCEEVIVPHAVFQELADGAKFDNAHLVVQLANARLMPPEISTLAEWRNLGAGELHVIAYAEIHRVVALLDDAYARKAARRNGIEVLGTLSLLLIAKAQGHVEALAPLIAVMRAGGYRLADGLVLDVLRAAGET